MCSIKTLDNINRAVVDGAMKYGSNALYKVFLYGSYARQDYDSESDIDYMVVMDGNSADMKKLRREMLNVSEQISYDNDVVVSVLVRDKIPLRRRKIYFPFIKIFCRKGLLYMDDMRNIPDLDITMRI